MSAMIRGDMPLGNEIDWLEQQSAPKPKAKPGRPEITLVQTPVINWLLRVCPGAIVAATNTERRGSGKTKLQRARFGMALKRSGNLPGFFDAVQLLDGPKTVLWEFKVPGGTVSLTQQGIHARAIQFRHIVIVCDGIESARWGLAQHGIPTIEARGQPAMPPKVYYEKEKVAGAVRVSRTRKAA